MGKILGKLSIKINEQQIEHCCGAGEMQGKHSMLESIYAFRQKRNVYR
jgi:hypothetical protein